MAKKKITLEQALDNLNILAEMTASSPSGHYVERPFSPIPKISRLLGGNSTQQKFLLASQDGCGKTTELNRLEELEKDKYFVVRCYHRHIYSMNEAHGTAFLLVLLRALADAAQAISSSLCMRIAASLGEIIKPSQGIDLDAVFPTLGIGFSTKPPSKEFSMVKLGNMREQASILSELDKFRSEVFSMVHKAMEDIRKDRDKPLLILVDDLEKIEYNDVYKLMTKNAQMLSSLPCAVVYTVPLRLLFSERHSLLDSEFHILDMGNIPIVNTGEDPIPVSEKFISEIAAKRIGHFWTGLEKRWRAILILISGGHLRQFLTLLSSMLLELYEAESPKVEIHHIKRAAIKINSGLRRLAYGADNDVLEKYIAAQYHIGEEHQRFLSSFLILEYWHPDIGRWYRANLLAFRSLVDGTLEKLIIAGAH